MGLGKVLSAALAIPLLLALPASAQTPPAALPFSLKMIGPGLYAAIGDESNAGFIVGDDAVLVVDSFFEPDTAKALLGEIRRITTKPVRYVVNTHYHVDHVSGDQVFKDAGAIIIAHRNVRAWIRPENLLQMKDAPDPAFKARIMQRIAQLPLPDLVNESPITVWLGGRRVDIRPAEGHTGSDLVVGVPDARVLFCGDLLWRMPPNIVDGTMSKWIETDRSFELLPQAASMVFVPGHGDVASVKDVAIFRGYLTDLMSLTAAGRKAGLKDDALAADVIPKLKTLHPDYPTPTRVLSREVTFMEQELDGTKRVPQPVP
ncbi:MAG TPA: MBL fold metallo-hydrolase [Rhizomicrobium sp.]|jgi:glyoxylase-like metal-dependent hydrolase (beta-lactamase superfamily II)